MIEHGAAPRHPEKRHRPDNPSPRKPHWIRVKAPTSPVYGETRRIVREHGLHTVCEEAACPNIGIWRHMLMIRVPSGYSYSIAKWSKMWP